MGYVYKYTHKITGKWYIGSHNGSDPNYSGSGLLWARAKAKHGLESFQREILYEGPDYREQEQKILTEADAANDPMSYNMKNEAMGGSFPGELNGMWGKKLSMDERHQCGNSFRGKSRPDHADRMRGRNNPSYGKDTHTHGLKDRAKENTGKTYEEIYGYEKAAALKRELSRSHTGKKYKLRPVKCPHCSKEGSGPNMTRYHFDNCKNKHSAL